MFESITLKVCMYNDCSTDIFLVKALTITKTLMKWQVGSSLGSVQYMAKPLAMHPLDDPIQKWFANTSS